MPRSTFTRRALLVLVSVALGGTPILTVSPSAVAASTPRFTDIEGSKFKADILWLAAEGITTGCAPTKFCPDGRVLRDQMATFLRRALGLPVASRDYFWDDAGNKHEDSINRVAQAGITRGCGARRYCPSGRVTRAQMASFLARALNLPPTTRDFYSDDNGSIHEGAINRLAAAGITRGCGTSRFCPSGTVTRGQMAAFLRRALETRAPSSAPATCPTTLQTLVDRAPSGSTLSVPACTYRETVTIAKPLTLTTTGARVDGQGTRKYAFVVKAEDVTIDGFEVTATVNPGQEGAVHVRSSNRFTLRNVHIHHTGGACVSISGGSGHRILDSELASCAQEGFHLARISDTLVARNRIHHNNPARAYDMNWEAGGGKATRAVRVVFEGNEVYANGGPGLWCDVDCREITYRNNRLHRNDWAGIMFEISDGAVITGNHAWENGWNKSTWGWGAGILVASSRNVEVTRNVVAWNADGISVISQNREGDWGWQPGVSTWNSVVNVVVHDNDIVLAPQPSDTSDRFMLAWLQDWSGGVVFDPASNNRGAKNRYWHAASEPSTRFAWAGGKSRLGDFNTTPGESSGRYLSTTERTAVLTATGMPGIATAR